MKKKEFLDYLRKSGFEEKVAFSSSYKGISIEFEEPVEIFSFKNLNEEPKEVFSLFSDKFAHSVIKVDFSDGEQECLDELTDEDQAKIFESLERGNWDFI